MFAHYGETTSRIKPGRAALSLYVAVVLHLLVLLGLALGSLLPQLPRGAGHGLGEAGDAAPTTEPSASAGRERAPARPDAAPTIIGLAPAPATTAASAQAVDLPAPRPPAEIAEPGLKTPAAPRAMAGGGTGGGRGGYLSDLRRHLSRHRRSLPGVLPGARSDVAFVVDASGSVSDIRLDRSSGVAALDQEAVALIHRAAPLPLPPQGQAMRLVVPVMVEEK